MEQSFEKLKALRDVHAPAILHDSPGSLQVVLDAIEATFDEVAGRYMPLPVDADGEPVFPGDDVTDIKTGRRMFVEGVSEACVVLMDENGERMRVLASLCRKSDDVGTAIWDAVREAATFFPEDAEALGGIARECARRIREARA